MSELTGMQEWYFDTKLAKLNLKIWNEELKAKKSGESQESLKERLKEDYKERDRLITLLGYKDDDDEEYWL